MSETPALVASGVTKKFGRTVALDDISLEVPQGCVFGLIGPNGSGKTTLIRIALDLLRASSGSVSLLGLDSRRSGVEARLTTNYLPGNLVLPPRLTGREYLADIATIRRAPGPASPDELVEALQVDVDRRIGHLSLGNRRKIGLVAALMNSPRLIFLDEPTGGMDPLVQQTFRRLVREQIKRGATVFLSSHVLDEVQHVSDRIAVVQRGSIVATGTVADLTARLTRTFIVTFSSVTAPSEFANVPNVTDAKVLDDPTKIVFSVRGASGALFQRLADFRPTDVRGAEPDLEDAFLDLYRTSR